MNIKKMLQAPLRSRQTARYEARIKEQTVRYHDWILRKEEKERSGRVLEGTGLFVKIYGNSVPNRGKSGKSA